MSDYNPLKSGVDLCYHCAKSVPKIQKQERERIIQILLRTDPEAFEDCSYRGGALLVFSESALRSALEQR